MISLRLVIDTNIVRQLTPMGCNALFCSSISEPARLYVSNAILTEYRDVLTCPEFQIRKGPRQQLIDLIRKRVHLVNPVRTVRVANDPDDNIFIECADAADSW
jgi:putative PIN family toxin of toxin-antitoxin system